MRSLFASRKTVDRLGNLAPQKAIYPDQLAPIARLDGDDIVLQLARWGMPSPKQFHSKSGIDRGVTNIRNTGSPHWRRWLKPENRCLVPLILCRAGRQGKRQCMVLHRRRAPGDVRGPLGFRMDQHPQVEGWRNQG
jgi:hypothetical protein